MKGAASFAVARALTQAEGQGFLDLGRAAAESSGGGGGASSSGMRVRHDMWAEMIPSPSKTRSVGSPHGMRYRDRSMRLTRVL